jgi:hypothetical protein
VNEVAGLLGWAHLHLPLDRRGELSASKSAPAPDFLPKMLMRCSSAARLNRGCTMALTVKEIETPPTPEEPQTD